MGEGRGKKGKIKVREEGGRTHLPYVGSLPKCLYQPGLGQSAFRKQKLHQGLPHG